MPCSRRSSTSPKRVGPGRRRRPLQLHPAQQGPDARRQLLGHDRLGDVVVGARLEAGDHVVGVGLGGDDDDRHDARRPQRPAHVEAGHVRQAQVEQHEVGLPLGERGQAGRPVGRLAHPVALVLEGHRQRQADLVVVLDEQQGVHSGAILPSHLRRSEYAVPAGRISTRRHTYVDVSVTEIAQIHALAPSQTRYKMSTVHAAPVRCLPPPGASPAAVNPCHTGARVPYVVRCACAPRSPSSSGSSRWSPACR